MTTAPVSIETAITEDRLRTAVAAGLELFLKGFTVFRAAQKTHDIPPAELASFQALWNDLAPDENLNGGTYRTRRYGRVRAQILADGPVFTALPHSTFQQSAEHIPIHMGKARHFEPISQENLSHPALLTLLTDGLGLIASSDSRKEWEIGLHMVRTVADENPGLPTPEGRHRDGHDYVGMHLLGRRDCVGGTSIIYREGQPDTTLTLLEPLDGMMVVDAAVMHEVTPIAATSGLGTRDMLLVDYNAIGDEMRESRP
ncbi:2OG-Fe dioxygenase family protein [Streptomyces sp. NPDC090131]|uniref:2OG-Fe dioxygenase family protein n=1 Tax=Streptomyces sp. NPDC090131 TaxID=3365954 RepID=UPI00381E85A2